MSMRKGAGCERSKSMAGPGRLERLSVITDCVRACNFELSAHQCIEQEITAHSDSLFLGTERRAERKEDGEDDSEEDEPVEIQLSDVTMHPKGTPAPASSVERYKCSKREWT